MEVVGVFIKEEKGSTLLLKLFAILFSIFMVLAYVFLHTVDATGKLIFQNTGAVCDANAVGYCFTMEILYFAILGVIAVLGFLTVTLTTLEWALRRESDSSIPDFYRNFVAFLNCIKIALAVLFTTLFINYSKATWVIPIAVFASLILDGFVWNKRCREVNAKHQSLFLDVITEFMNIFTTKRSRNAENIPHRHSLVFYVVATLFIIFCVHAISGNIKPDFGQNARSTIEQVDQAKADSTVSEVQIEEANKAKKFVKAKIRERRRKKIEAARIRALREAEKSQETPSTEDNDEDTNNEVQNDEESGNTATNSEEADSSETHTPVAASSIPAVNTAANTTSDDDDDEDWW